MCTFVFFVGGNAGHVKGQQAPVPSPTLLTARIWSSPSSSIQQQQQKSGLKLLLLNMLRSGKGRLRQVAAHSEIQITTIILWTMSLYAGTGESHSLPGSLPVTRTREQDGAEKEGGKVLTLVDNDLYGGKRIRTHY